MTFIHPALLAGLILVGIPVLLHLIMRQKPKHLLFPAMRFLLQRHRTNQRKIQLRHLLLLLMRMFLIAAICLALARPKIFSERLNITNQQPRAVVLLIDTSPSMEYKSGVSRLDEAKRLAQELLDDLPEGSRAAILDSADGGDWAPTLSYARDRLAALQIRPANYPVTSQLGIAYDLVEKLAQDADAEALVKFLYVFSDRTQASWDQSQVENLQRLRDRLGPPGLNAVFVDVGIDKPEDLALASVELPKQVISAEGKMELRATVRGTGRDYDTEVVCQIDGEEVGRKPVKLAAGQSKVVAFERRNLAAGAHQAVLKLPTGDAALTLNDVGYATFEVRGGRRVLTITDDVRDVRIWNLALETGGAFKVETRTPGEAGDMSPIKEMARYQAICLVNVARPSPGLWEKLERYVRDGGGLAIIPGAELNKESYDEEKHASLLLPGKYVQLLKADSKYGAIWNVGGQHPLMVRFREWGQSATVDFFRPGLEPAALRYWEVAPAEAYVVVPYADKKKRPALLERNADRKQVRGRVLQFTTPLDDAHTAPRDNQPRWNNYLQSSFYLVLAQQTVGYLAGDAEDGSFNFPCGQTVPITLPPTPRFPTYTIQGPGLSGLEAIVSRAENESVLHLTKAVMPGNYTVVGVDNKHTASFSLNIPAEETLLTRVPVEQIEALFGPGAVLSLDFKSSLRDALENRWSHPIEIFPWLMILILLVLAVENLLANKFYRQDGPAGEPSSVGEAGPGGDLTR